MVYTSLIYVMCIQTLTIKWTCRRRRRVLDFTWSCALSWWIHQYTIFDVYEGSRNPRVSTRVCDVCPPRRTSIRTHACARWRYSCSRRYATHFHPVDWPKAVPRLSLNWRVRSIFAFNRGQFARVTLYDVYSNVQCCVSVYVCVCVYALQYISLSTLCTPPSSTPPHWSLNDVNHKTLFVPSKPTCGRVVVHSTNTRACMHARTYRVEIWTGKIRPAKVRPAPWYYYTCCKVFRPPSPFPSSQYVHVWNYWGNHGFLFYNIRPDLINVYRH